MEMPSCQDNLTQPVERTEITYNSFNEIINPKDGKPLNGILISQEGYIRVVDGIAGKVMPFPGSVAQDNTFR
jgi:hypothetical protein